MSRDPDFGKQTAPRRSMQEVQRELNAKLDEARKWCKAATTPMRYVETSQRVQGVIDRCMRVQGLDLYQAVDQLTKAALERGDQASATWLAAACADMVDPEHLPARTTILHA